MRPLKKLQARFYETPTGRKAVREWLLGLEDGDRRTIGYDTRRSNSVGLSACRHVVRWGDGLWEVRSDLSGGSIGRVIFCIAKGDMVLLHGFIKKTQKTPRRDIDLANQRRKEIE